MLAVDCQIRARVSLGDVRLCQVIRRGQATYVTIASGLPLTVEITASAAATGQYLPYRQSFSYRVG